MQLFLFEFFDFSACVFPYLCTKVTHGGFGIHIHLSHTNMSVKVLDAYLFATGCDPVVYKRKRTSLGDFCIFLKRFMS